MGMQTSSTFLHRGGKIILPRTWGNIEENLPPDLQQIINRML